MLPEAVADIKIHSAIMEVWRTTVLNTLSLASPLMQLGEEITNLQVSGNRNWHITHLQSDA
jgi:hypothetical protein